MTRRWYMLCYHNLSGILVHCLQHVSAAHLYSPVVLVSPNFEYYRSKAQKYAGPYSADHLTI